MKKIGQGCSRSAYLREDGKIVKKPRYNAPDYDAAQPDSVLISALIDQFPENAKLQKVVEFMDKGYYIAPPCAGILAEYLVSLYISNRAFANNFALCEDIKVRKKPGAEAVSIVGVYENAEEKEYDPRCEDYILPFFIGDTHAGNYVNGILVDYANICSKSRD